MKIKKEKVIVIIFFILVGLYLSRIILPRNFGDLDEIWNYNIASNIANGKLPYVDISTIVTPLLPIINSIFLKLFGNQLIVMRCLAILLNLGILVTTYKILKELKINTYVSLLSVTGLIYLLKEYMVIDYNFFALELILIIVYLELRKANGDNERNIKSDIKHEIIVGIIAGLIICTKQTVGILVVIALLIYKIILIRNKQELKEYGKSTLNKLIGVLIPLILLAIYFTVNGMWKDFTSYCIVGIKEFSNSIPYTFLLENEKMEIKILSVLIPIILLYMLIMYFVARFKPSTKNNNLLTIVPFAIAEAIIIYPISDVIHFYAGMYLAIIGTIYIIYTLIKNLIKKIQKKELKIFIEVIPQVSVLVISVIITFWYTVPNLCEYVFDTHKSSIKQYAQIPIDDIEDRILEISYYIEIQECPVYILDAEAAIYKIPINRYDKNYDMFLKGNLGAGGQNKEIEKIKQEKNAKYLIKKPQYSRNWQSPEEVVEYVLKNLAKTGEVSIYDVYEPKPNFKEIE